jgi:hypothetical protein
MSSEMDLFESIDLAVAAILGRIDFAGTTSTNNSEADVVIDGFVNGIRTAGRNRDWTGKGRGKTSTKHDSFKVSKTGR